MLSGPLFKKNNPKVIWEPLSGNPNAIYILQNNLDKVDWDNLSRNPNAIPILENNLDKVSGYCLSMNPNAIHLLFKYDYQTMKKNHKDFCEELVKKVFNPNIY